MVPSPTEPESALLATFRAAWEEGNRAWNEGDFKRAYATLPDDFEYRLGPNWPNARPLRGRDEVVAFFEDFRQTFPDARAENQRFIEADERTLIVGFTVTGTGRSSGADTAMEFWQVWEMGKEMVPVRATEFGERRAALEAADAERAAERGT